MVDRIEKPAGGDEFDRYVELMVAREREMWESRMDGLRLEMRALRTRNDRLTEVLGGIFQLLPPDPVEHDGKTFVFQDPNANNTLRMLKTRILWISEAVNAIGNAQASSAMQSVTKNKLQAQP